MTQGAASLGWFEASLERLAGVGNPAFLQINPGEVDPAVGEAQFRDLLEDRLSLAQLPFLTPERPPSSSRPMP